MGRLACECGEIIHDSLVPNPDKGYLIRDQDMAAYFQCQARILSELLQAVAAGKRQEWITAHFGPDYPTDIPDSEFLFDLLHSCRSDYELEIHQCRHCGRVAIQASLTGNWFYYFRPAATPAEVIGLLHKE